MKTTIICAVKNRTESLIVAMHSWLIHNEVDEVIIVDWSSNKEIKHLLDVDNRIKIIRVDNQKYFHLAGAYNLAADFAQNELILKLDADYLLMPYTGFFKKYNINSNEFLSGFEAFTQPNCFHRSLSGLLFIHTFNFKAVCGYNEYMHNWGYDDEDLCMRLVDLELKQKIINFKNNCIIHLPHSDGLRTDNYEISELSVSREINRKIKNENKYKQRLLNWEVMLKVGNYKKIRASSDL